MFGNLCTGRGLLLNLLKCMWIITDSALLIHNCNLGHKPPDLNLMPWKASALTCFLVALLVAGGRPRQRRKAGRWLSAAAGLQSAAGSALWALGCTETRPPVQQVLFQLAPTSPSPPQASYPSAAGRRARRPGSGPSLCCQTLSCPPANDTERFS